VTRFLAPIILCLCLASELASPRGSMAKRMVRFMFFMQHCCNDVVFMTDVSMDVRQISTIFLGIGRRVRAIHAYFPMSTTHRCSCATVSSASLRTITRMGLDRAPFRTTPEIVSAVVCGAFRFAAWRRFRRSFGRIPMRRFKNILFTSDFLPGTPLEGWSVDYTTSGVKSKCDNCHSAVSRLL
jgi:hypothetical protein